MQVERTTAILSFVDHSRPRALQGLVVASDVIYLLTNSEEGSNHGENKVWTA